MIEELLEAELGRRDVSIGDFAEFVERQCAECEVPGWVPFQNELNLAEDYYSFWEMMSAAGQRRAAEAEQVPKPSAAVPQHLQDVAAVRSIFTSFLDACTAEGTLSAFKPILELCSPVKPGDANFYEAVKGSCRSHLNRSSGGLLDCIDRKVAEQDVKRKHCRYTALPMKDVQCVVCGGGPVGFRMAAELKLLGADVTLFEMRVACTRFNQLKLWEWVKFDLLALGAKHLYPMFGVCSGSIHIGTKQLQLLLLKVCLILGVRVHFGAKLFEQDGELHSCPTGVMNDVGTPVPCDLLFECGGPNSLALPNVGHHYTRIGLAQAIGLVANYAKHPGPGEHLAEFNWAFQYNPKLCKHVTDRSGVVLENAVYFRGEETHYFVMTPKRASLLSTGVLKRVPRPEEDDQSANGPLDPAWVQIDREELVKVSRLLVDAFNLPSECALVNEPQLFDFSTRRSCDHGLKVPLVRKSVAVPGLVALCGDALLEPFWPEGLGITRGFLGALDTAWVLSGLPAALLKNPVECEELKAALRTRDDLLRRLKQLSGATQRDYIRDDARRFGLNPATRWKYQIV